MRFLRYDGSQPGKIRLYLVQSALLALAATAFVSMISRTTPFDDFDHWTYDFTVFYAGLTNPGKQILLVDFDDDTFARMQRYPVPRNLIAEVVDRIGAQKPRVIGMDILISEPRADFEDKAMQDALTRAAVVIVASQDGEAGLPAARPLPMFCKPEEPGAPTSFCVEGEPGAMGYASINLGLDEDGIVRQGLIRSLGSQASAGFAVTLAQQYTGKAIEAVDGNRFRFLGRTHVLLRAEPEKDPDRLLGPAACAYRLGLACACRRPADGSLHRQACPHRPIERRRPGPALHAALPVQVSGRHPQTDGWNADSGGNHPHAARRHGCPARAGVAALGGGVRACWVASLAILWLRTSLGVGTMIVSLIVPILTALLLYGRFRFWMPFLAQEMGLVITLPLTLFVQFLSESVLAQEARSQRMQLMKLFSSYVDPAVAGTIWERRDEVSLNGEERTATVMFTDIRSFTAMSAGKPPAEVLLWLNQYMTAMDEVIRLHGGFLNKFIGDGLMIIFGLPLSHGVRQDAQRGLHAAMAMLKRVDLLNRENARFPERPQLRIGIGIHTGPLMAGSIGSASRQEYSVIGETVNLASRLESLNKPFKTEILMSQATHDILVNDFAGFQPLGETKVAGFDQPISVFTIQPHL